jgi:hypothetical protein
LTPFPLNRGGRFVFLDRELRRGLYRSTAVLAAYRAASSRNVSLMDALKMGMNLKVDSDTMRLLNERRQLTG